MHQRAVEPDRRDQPVPLPHQNGLVHPRARVEHCAAADALQPVGRDDQGQHEPVHRHRRAEARPEARKRDKKLPAIGSCREREADGRRRAHARAERGAPRQLAREIGAPQARPPLRVTAAVATAGAATRAHGKRTRPAQRRWRGADGRLESEASNRLQQSRQKKASEASVWHRGLAGSRARGLAGSRAGRKWRRVSLLRGPPLSPGVVRGVTTTSINPLSRAPLSIGASAAEWEILDGKRVDLLSGAPGQAEPGSGTCGARLGPMPGPTRAPCRARLAPPKPNPHTLPGPACHSRAEAPKSAGRGARRARRGENGPGKPSCPGPSAAHRPARSLTAGPGQEGLPGPFCAIEAGPARRKPARLKHARRPGSGHF